MAYCPMCSRSDCLWRSQHLADSGGSISAFTPNSNWHHFFSELDFSLTTFWDDVEQRPLLHKQFRE